MEKQKILLVDDEQDILEIMQYNLEKEGFEVKTASSGSGALKTIEGFKPDLILLDVMMPEMDGVEICLEIRANDNMKDVIIAFLTARNEDYSQIAGFEAGADDYIAKPIKPRVLISRIKALLRRGGVSEAAVTNKDDAILRIDKDKYLVYHLDQELVLPRKEFELLTLLFSSPGKVFTRDIILNSVWGNDVVVGDRTIDVHIRKLREKLGDTSIKTIKGVGYKLDI